jgi:hypothetical protein
VSRLPVPRRRNSIIEKRPYICRLDLIWVGLIDCDFEKCLTAPRDAELTVMANKSYAREWVAYLQIFWSSSSPNIFRPCCVALADSFQGVRVPKHNPGLILTTEEGLLMSNGLPYLIVREKALKIMVTKTYTRV